MASFTRLEILHVILRSVPQASPLGLLEEPHRPSCRIAPRLLSNPWGKVYTFCGSRIPETKKYQSVPLKNTGSLPDGLDPDLTSTLSNSGSKRESRWPLKILNAKLCAKGPEVVSDDSLETETPAKCL